MTFNMQPPCDRLLFWSLRWCSYLGTPNQIAALLWQRDRCASAFRSYYTEILNRRESFNDDETFVRITTNEIPRRVTKIPLQFLLRYILLNMQCEIKFIVQISRLQIRIKIHTKLDSIIWCTRICYLLT